VVHLSHRAHLLSKGIIGDVVSGLAATSTTKTIVQATTEVNAYKSTADVEYALQMNPITGANKGCKESASTAHMRLSSLPWDLDPEFHQLQASSSYRRFQSHGLAKKPFNIFDRDLSDFFPDLPRSSELELGSSSESKLFTQHLQGAVGLDGCTLATRDTSR
jgi:hypothetical protein